MRETSYGFVFDDWDRTQGALDFGWAPVFHECLPYASFWLILPDSAVVVRCDPCSLDQDRTAYAAMVRMDLEKAMAKRSQNQPNVVEGGWNSLPLEPVPMPPGILADRAACSDEVSPPESDAPARLARHLRNRMPTVAKLGNDVVLAFDESGDARAALGLILNAMGAGNTDWWNDQGDDPSPGIADSFARPRNAETSIADQCMQSK